jgi:hypothetical protein
LKDGIQDLRNRTQEVLLQFCPSLPNVSFFLIWGFGTCDVVIHAQFFCDFLQSYYGLITDRNKKEITLLQIALKKKIQDYDAVYLQEQPILRHVKSAVELLAETTW